MREDEPARRPFWHLRRRPPAVASDVDEELAAHIDMRAEELRATGCPLRRHVVKRSDDSATSRRHAGTAGTE